ncbi:response regulator transcription factor [bacterium Scap17]|nr:response regulator transcription factor [bacterium Scap17]
MTVTRQMSSTHQTPSTPPTRVVLVDDHPLFRRGLAELFSEGGLFEVVADFDDGSDLLETLPTLAPELVIVDWQMPQLDGLTLMRHLKQHDATLKVVLLTASDDSRHLLDAIQQGADGYLMKDTDPERILERLQAVVDGNWGWRKRPCYCSPGVCSRTTASANDTPRHLHINRSTSRSRLRRCPPRRILPLAPHEESATQATTTPLAS